MIRVIRLSALVKDMSPAPAAECKAAVGPVNVVKEPRVLHLILAILALPKPHPWMPMAGNLETLWMHLSGLIN